MPDEPTNEPLTDLPGNEPEPGAEPVIPAGDEPQLGAEPTPEPGAEPAPEPAAPPAEDPRDTAIKTLQTRLDEMAEQLKAKAEPQPGEPEPVKEPSPEFWEAQKQFLGFKRVKGEDGTESTTLDENAFVKGVFKLIQEGMSQVKGYADKQIHGNVSDMRFDAVLSEMEPKTPGIRKYAPQIKEYLKKRYQPKDYSNPDYIMDGLRWVRGGEVLSGKPPATPRPNGRVVPVTPASPGARPAGGPRVLSEEAKRMIADGTFKNAEEYFAWQKADPSKL